MPGRRSLSWRGISSAVQGPPRTTRGCHVSASVGIHDPGGIRQARRAGAEAAPLGQPGRAGGPAHRGGHRRYAREIIDGLAGSSLGTLNDKYEDELATARKTLREKRRIIQLLLESESRYRDLVETSHDLIWTTDAQGRFTYLNNGALDIFGMQPKDLLGRCFFDFEARPSHISNRRFLSTLRRHGEVKNYITHLLAARRQRPLGRHQRARVA